MKQKLKKVFLQTFIICVVALLGWLMLDAWIDDRYHPNSLTTEFVREAFWIGKPFLIECEDSVSTHVIDVEIHDVEWQISFAILVYNFFNHRVGIVTPAALLIA